MKVSISATIAPIDAPSCGADPLPPVHLGEMRLDVDPALAPAAADPLVAQFRYALRRAFGAAPSDATPAPPAGPLSVATRSRDRYSVLAFCNAPRSRRDFRPLGRLTGRAVSWPRAEGRGVGIEFER